MVALFARPQEQRAVTQLPGGQQLVDIPHRLFIHIGPLLLDQAPGLAPRAAQPDPLEQLGGGDARFQLRRCNLGARDGLGHLAPAEELARRILRFAGGRLAMQDLGGLKGQDLFGLADVGSGQPAQFPHLRHRQESKDGQESRHVGVLGVDPVLVVLVRRDEFWVEPDGSFRSLAHLGPGVCGQQRVGDGIDLGALHPADQVHAGQDVAPLIVAASLECAAVRAVDVQKVVGLQQLVVEL